MNVFLIIVLVLSGLAELVVGLWALLVSTGLTDLWLPWTDNLSGPLGILLFVAGLAGIYMAALHVAAIRWLQIERPEAYPFSIALGVAVMVFGVATYAYTQMSTSTVGQMSYLLAIDAVRGAILALAGIVAMRAPATVTQLRVPAQRGRAASRRGRDTTREGRDARSRRTRDGERPSRRTGQRRRVTAREGGTRSSRSPRDAQQPRPASPDRRERRRERTSVRSREAVSESAETADPLRRRRLSSRDDGTKERERKPLGRPRVPPLPETEDVRNLGVVVTGKRPDQRKADPTEEGRPSRSEPRKGKEEKPQRPLAPMVPSLRTENGKSRRSSDRQATNGEQGARGSHSRSRQRRQRPSSRESRDREPVVGSSTTADEPFDHPPRSSGDSGPSGNRLVTRAEADESLDASVDRRMHGISRPEHAEEPETASVPRLPASEPPMQEEPIDRISAFRDGEEKDSEERDQANDTGFGRHRRPFTPHRRSRQVKPRESKVRQSLGGNQSKEDAEPVPNPPEIKPEARERRVRMENGIGPVDLEDPGSPEED